MRAIPSLVAITLFTTTLVADVSTSQRKRIEEAAAVLKEIHAVPDKDIPQELWNKAACVIVVPGLKKAAFVIGGEYGKGLMSCRRNGAWSAPIFMQVGKGSWGFQIGAQSIDLVLLVMNERGTQKMLRNKVTLGAEASVAARASRPTGPPATDASAPSVTLLRNIFCVPRSFITSSTRSIDCAPI